MSGLCSAHRHHEKGCVQCEALDSRNTCDKCGKTEDGIGWFAKAFRRVQLKRGNPDPGNLCGSCAGSATGKEIGRKIAAEPPQ